MCNLIMNSVIKYTMQLKHEQPIFIWYTTYLKNDPSYEFIGEVILK
jgi:hypothetical protein